MIFILYVGIIIFMFELAIYLKYPNIFNNDSVQLFNSALVSYFVSYLCYYHTVYKERKDKEYILLNYSLWIYRNILHMKKYIDSIYRNDTLCNRELYITRLHSKYIPTLKLLEDVIRNSSMSGYSIYKIYDAYDKFKYINNIENDFYEKVTRGILEYDVKVIEMIYNDFRNSFKDSEKLIEKIETLHGFIDTVENLFPEHKRNFKQQGN